MERGGDLCMDTGTDVWKMENEKQGLEGSIKSKLLKYA